MINTRGSSCENDAGHADPGARPARRLFKTRRRPRTPRSNAFRPALRVYRRLHREQLDQVPGVRGSRTLGVPASEVRVAIDSGCVAQLGLPASVITAALRSNGTDLPPGAVHAGDQRYNIQTGGAYRSVDAVAQGPVRAVADNGTGRVLRVRDIADVGWAYEEQPQLTRFNGKRAIWITLTQKDNINVLDIQRDALKVANAYTKTLPPDIRLDIGFDQSLDIYAVARAAKPPRSPARGRLPSAS